MVISNFNCVSGHSCFIIVVLTHNKKTVILTIGFYAKVSEILVYQESEVIIDDDARNIF